MDMKRGSQIAVVEGFSQNCGIYIDDSNIAYIEDETGLVVSRSLCEFVNHFSEDSEEGIGDVVEARKRCSIIDSDDVRNSWQSVLSSEPLRDLDETATHVESLIGSSQFDLGIKNNSHFISWCKTGNLQYSKEWGKPPKEMKAGDHIHFYDFWQDVGRHGVYCGAGKVAYFDNRTQKAVKVNLERFVHPAKLSKIKICSDYEVFQSSAAVVGQAEALIGCAEIDTRLRDDENFAVWCKTRDMQHPKMLGIVLENLKKGDHIYLPSYCEARGRHGIYCGEEQVAYLDKIKKEIVKTSIDGFVSPAKLSDAKVRDYPYSKYGESQNGDAVVAQADALVGCSQFDAKLQSDEHFANWCKTGDPQHEARWGKLREELKRGDHLYFRTPKMIAHHGIYCGDEQVIHFDGHSKKIIKSNLEEFVYPTKLSGIKVFDDLPWRKGIGKQYEPDEVVRRAELYLEASQQNRLSYNIAKHNCEHFAFACRTGVWRSDQTDDWGARSIKWPLFAAAALAPPPFNVLAVLSSGLAGAAYLEARAKINNPVAICDDSGLEGPSFEHKPLADSEFEGFGFEVIKVDENGKEISKVRKAAKYFAENLGDGVTLDIVKIPGGSFQMGSENLYEDPKHQVELAPFAMGKYTVTQKQWCAVASLPKVERDLETSPAHFKGEDLPIENVSWDDAVEFCNRLMLHTGRRYRLPSEAEWEYACRAGTATKFYFGNKLTPELAQCKSTIAKSWLTVFSGQTAPVGSYFPNQFGLYDMHGNVQEWCADLWHNNYEEAPTDGSAWLKIYKSENRVVRGGDYSTAALVCESSSRSSQSPDYRIKLCGFRVVCELL